VKTVDALRPPSRLDPTAAAYKDWLHLNVFDHESGAVGLVNVSLHGSPRDPRSRAVGAALFHLPAAGWVGNLEVLGLSEANIGRASIGLERVAVAADGARGDVLASARLPEDELTVDVTATAVSPPLDADLPLPLGPRWISWYVIPRLTLRGHIRAAGEALDLAHASAYHDHNWGRWHWGDDLGWEWGCFLAPPPEPAFVLVRTTDRAHRKTSRPLLLVQVGPRRRSFAGRTVELASEGLLEARPRRLPGSLAALHQDRAVPRLPGRLHVCADDGADRVTLDFRPRASAQMIAADPAERGYGFVHELVGEFAASWRLRGEERETAGLGVMEYVD
jgi:hypothetical protein